MIKSKSGTYTPHYKALPIDPTSPNRHDGVLQEEENQQAVAEADVWYVPKKQVEIKRGILDMINSRSLLEKLGFEVFDDAPADLRKLFYRAEPPKGWKKETDGYWTITRNAKGTIIFRQFYKGAAWDSRAHLMVEGKQALKRKNKLLS